MTVVFARKVRWRHWLGGRPLTGKIAAVALAAGWMAAVLALLFLV